MKKSFIIAACGLFAAASLLMNGCASIVSKSTWPVTANCVPGDVDVTVKNSDGMQIMQAKAPTTLMLKSGNGYFCSAKYMLEFKKEGYEPQTVMLVANMNGWYMGNMLFGGLIGFFIVDPLTGAMYELPPSVFASLPEKPAAKTAALAPAATAKAQP